MLPHSLTHFAGLVVLLVISAIVLANNVAAQTATTTSLANNPGCYARCRYIQLDYDPTRMDELCDKERSLGSLFLDNIKSCAECVEEEGELSEYFDRANAQDALDIVNLCQSLFGTDHEEMVSAMSVISSVGGVVGTIASPSVTVNSTTNVPTSTTSSTTTTTTDPSSPTPNPATDESAPSEESSAWIAGPVVGSVAGVAVIIAAALLLLRRRRKRRQATADPDNGEDKDHSKGGADDHHLYGKPELPGEGHTRHELDGHSAAVETIARPPPQELDAGEVVGAELPTNNVK
ncbi:hypothetical protein BJY01DRAFT_209983 [Aspergillus pseudoustus]|uniref:Uncharacterized protein n=1 Tax=Aspergillus pseudoustus TaxID=1810923 RepID=A0ABR4KDE1_9EURO